MLACMRGPEEAIVEAKELVKKAIRTKVLESYHNGQAAGPRTQQQRRPYGGR
jgi:hydroxymethylpyrimidine/phosphomethylpyrimidine kinase